MKLAPAFLVLCVGANMLAACGGPNSSDESSNDELGRGQSTERAWLSLRPQQADNPWDRETSMGGAAVMGAPRDESQDDERVQVASYFSDQQIKLAQVGFVLPSGLSGGCMALSCPRGDLLIVKAASEDGEKKLIDAHRMTKLEGALQHPACDGPWAARLPRGAASSLAIHAAARDIGDWARQQGAPVSSAGFARRGEGPAGTCSVGDIAVVVPTNEAASQLLRQRGWKPL